VTSAKKVGFLLSNLVTKSILGSAFLLQDFFYLFLGFYPDINIIKITDDIGLTTLTIGVYVGPSSVISFSK